MDFQNSWILLLIACSFLNMVKFNFFSLFALHSILGCQDCALNALIRVHAGYLVSIIWCVGHALTEWLHNLWSLIVNHLRHSDNFYSWNILSFMGAYCSIEIIGGLWWLTTPQVHVGFEWSLPLSLSGCIGLFNSW